MGKTKRGKGTKLMAVADGSGLPLAVHAESASPHEVRLVRKTLVERFTDDAPKRLIGDKAYDSDPLDAELAEAGIEMIAPHKANRKRAVTQDGRKLRRYKRRWKVERLFAWLQNFRRRTLELLYLYLREWAYEVYDTIEHPALGQSPRDAFARGMVTAGERAHRLITYNDEFRQFTLPTTRKGAAKVQPGRGVKINNFYYWSEAFRRPEVEGVQARVRYDPFNMGLGFAYVRGEWVECHSEYYSIFRDRTEREIMLATAELRARSRRHSRQFYVTAARLAEFLESVESEEVLLRQRAADREARNVLRLINNEAMPREPEQNTDTTSTAAIAPSNTSLQQVRSFDDAHDAKEIGVYGKF